MENLTTLIDLRKAFDKINHKILLKKCLPWVCQLSQLLRLNLTSEVVDFKLLSKINVTGLMITNSYSFWVRQDPNYTVWHKKETIESSLDIRYGKIHIRKHHAVTYLDCASEKDLLVGLMPLNIQPSQLPMAKGNCLRYCHQRENHQQQIFAVDLQFAMNLSLFCWIRSCLPYKCLLL